MLLILLSYFYFFFILVGMGFCWSPWINWNKKNIVLLLLSGLFSQLIFTSFYAFFAPINSIFYAINTILSLLLIAFNKSKITKLLQQEKSRFTSFSPLTKGVFFVMSILILIQSSSLPYIIDNESYYIQSIRWLNQVGITKGLANLHIFLGQMSGWHILQSSFNFSFIAPFFNDLNGFLSIIMAYLYLSHWESYKKNKSYNSLFISTIFLFYLFFFPFIDSPSPDLPIYLIAPVIVFLFLKNYTHPQSEENLLLLLLSFLLILIKVTAFPILIFGLVLMFKNINKSLIIHFISLSVLSLSLFMLKNYWLTGYPLYPLDIGGKYLSPDWKIPAKMRDFYYYATQLYAWKIQDPNILAHLSFWDKFKLWFFQPKLNGIFNKSLVFMLVSFPFFTWRKKANQWIYLYFITLFISLYFTSPQYRFLLPILFIGGAILLSSILKNRPKIIAISLSISLLCSAIFVLFIFNLSSLSNNEMMINKTSLKLSQIIIPQGITKYPQLKYKTQIEGNLKFYTPKKDSLFFWQTSNAPLPASNKQIIDYFKQTYKIIPQKRTHNIKDGFYSKSL